MWKLVEWALELGAIIYHIYGFSRTIIGQLFRKSPFQQHPNVSNFPTPGSDNRRGSPGGKFWSLFKVLGVGRGIVVR